TFNILNNIRVCLSSNTCFVKVPINPECPNAKRNFWKVDESKITPKILRRHFGALRDVFPDFYENMEVSSVKNETENNRATLKRLEAEKKFTSPFSIESLLQRESSAPLRNRPALCATRNLENAFVGLLSFPFCYSKAAHCQLRSFSKSFGGYFCSDKPLIALSQSLHLCEC
uniref:Si:ch211-239d6.2 n=1 Tax=Cyprinus carpio carpio TaxID=630221 RepID=A0A8C1DU43_CYPCA